jgi:hypothetical protein
VSHVMSREDAEQVVRFYRAKVTQVVHTKGTQRWNLMLPDGRVRTLKVQA